MSRVSGASGLSSLSWDLEAGGVTVWALSSLAESFSELMVLMGRFEADGLKEVAASKSSLRRHSSIFGADGLSKRMPALILSICSILWIL